MQSSKKSFFTQFNNQYLKLFSLFLASLFFSFNLSAQDYYQYEQDPALQSSKASKDILDITPLMSATASNDIEGVKFFTSSGPSIINQKNYGGATALHIAARNNNVQIAEILIKSGANLNIADNENYTPAMRAAAFGNEDIIQILAQNNANFSTINSNNDSVIVIAARAGCNSCLDIIFNQYDFAKNLGQIFLKEQLNKAFEISRSQGNEDSANLIKSYLAKSNNFSQIKYQNYNKDKEIIVEELTKIGKDNKTKEKSTKYVISKPQFSEEDTAIINEPLKADSEETGLFSSKPLSNIGQKQGNKPAMKKVQKNKLKLKKQKFIFKKPPQKQAPKPKKEELLIKINEPDLPEKDTDIIPVKKPEILLKEEKKEDKKEQLKYKFKPLKTPKKPKAEPKMEAKKQEAKIIKTPDIIEEKPEMPTAQEPISEPKKKIFKFKKPQTKAKPSATKEEPVIDLNNYQEKDSSLKIFKFSDVKPSFKTPSVKSSIAYRLIRN